MARVKDRVTKGGHHVPIEDVKRRFERSLVNFFKTYRSLLNSWLLFDNSAQKPKLIAKKNNAHIDVENNDLFQKILSKVGVKL
jgi:predicted ABC-type ATPase